MLTQLIFQKLDSKKLKKLEFIWDCEQKKLKVSNLENKKILFL